MRPPFIMADPIYSIASIKHFIIALIVEYQSPLTNLEHIRTNVLHTNRLELVVVLR